MENGRLQGINRGVAFVGLLLAVFLIYMATPFDVVEEKNHMGVVELRNWGGMKDLSDGDLVFRTGRDMMSRMVLSQGDSPQFSHVGIILVLRSGIVVVHAIPGDTSSSGGVLMEPLSSFGSFENASDIGFLRVKGIDANARREIREYALRQIGKPFDYEFLLSEDVRFYCTELVLKSLSAAGINLKNSLQYISVMLLSEPLIPPDYLRRSSRLEPILPNFRIRIAEKAGLR